MRYVLSMVLLRLLWSYVIPLIGWNTFLKVVIHSLSLLLRLNLLYSHRNHTFYVQLTQKSTSHMLLGLWLFLGRYRNEQIQHWILFGFIDIFILFILLYFLKYTLILCILQQLISLSGVNFMALNFRTFEAYASAAALFPEEWVVRTLISSENWSSLLKIPLTLKAPIFCRF